MRPRPEGRGERDIVDRVRCHRPALQCGHDPKAVENPAARPVRRRTVRCFNAATTRRPWRTTSTTVRDQPIQVLQCGHDPKAVENGRCGWQATAGSQGFNAATTRRPWRTSVAHKPMSLPIRASMRPRPEGRGERDAAGNTLQSAWMLQCGHDPKAVENVAQQPLPELQCPKLQCGHDPKAVENRQSTSPMQTSWPRFNAATTRRPWRTDRAAAEVGSGVVGFNAATTRRPWRTP